MRIGPVSGDKATVPGEKVLGSHREAAPRRTGETAAQRGQQGAVGGLVSRTSDLASEHRNLVAQRQQLNLIRLLRAHQDYDELKCMAQREVDEGPKPTTHPVPTHLEDGSAM
jgi:hypothetical protein